MSLRATVFLGLLSAIATAQAPGDDFIRVHQPGALPAPLATLVERLDTTQITRYLTFLTAPEQQGRGLGTRGLQATAQYLTHQLKTLGISSLGPSYHQTVPLCGVRPGQGAVHLKLGPTNVTFEGGHQAVLPSIEPGTLSGPAVFVGHGIQEVALQHDDFRHIDVRGKVVVFLDGLPEGEAWRKPELLAKYASERRADRYDARLALLEKLGAKAAIALEEGLEARITAGQEPMLPSFLAAPGVLGSGEPPLARVALTPGLRALAMSNREGTATLQIRGQVRALKSLNVLGFLKGSDPVLNHEAILIGAHMDHLGLPKGVLHPGADDNASGVSALLELCRVLAASPTRPRRSILVAFWTGEEEGKFGSNHYARHPRWPLARTNAYLNLDMIGHPWLPADLDTLLTDAGLKDAKAFLAGLDPATFAEPGLSTDHRDLGPILAQAGRGTGMSLHLDWTDGRNGGSDYRDFARLKVPFVRFFGSYFPEYHQPGDTLDQLDPEQVKRIARLVLATAWLLADR